MVARPSRPSADARGVREQVQTRPLVVATGGRPRQSRREPDPGADMCRNGLQINTFALSRARPCRGHAVIVVCAVPDGGPDGFQFYF